MQIRQFTRCILICFFQSQFNSASITSIFAGQKKTGSTQNPKMTCDGLFGNSERGLPYPSTVCDLRAGLHEYKKTKNK